MRYSLWFSLSKFTDSVVHNSSVRTMHDLHDICSVCIRFAFVHHSQFQMDEISINKVGN